MRFRVAMLASVGGVGLLGIVGCLGPAAGARPETPGPSAEEPPEAPSFQPLGDASVTANVSPEDYWVVGWTFAAPGELQGELPLEGVVSDAPASARRDLQAILQHLEVARSRVPSSRSPGLEAPAPAVERGERSYRLSLARRWILDLELLELAGGTNEARVSARLDERELTFVTGASSLLRYLRGLAFKSLTVAVTRPRVPSAWHIAALASLLALHPASATPPLPADPAERARLRAVILSFLESGDDAPKVARAIVSRVGIFEPEEVARFAGASSLPIRLLALTRSAAAGSRPALDEILATSLEYFGEELLFGAALEVLFPRELNAELHALYPEKGTSPTVALAFIQEIRARVSKATFRSGEGWVL